MSNIELNCTALLQELLTQLINNQERPCVIYDDLKFFAESVASKLNLPSMVLYVSSAANIHSYFAYSPLHEEGYLPVQESRLQELIPRLHPLRFKDLCVPDFRILDDLLQLLAKIINTGTSSAIIWNTVEFLETSTLSKIQQLCQIPLFTIGSMHKMAPTSLSLLEEDRSFITWLNKQKDKSVIYVCFGSLVSIAEEEQAEMAWDLANSNQPFLWVIRPSSVRGSETIDEVLPSDFVRSVGERGCIVKGAPQLEVLAHNAIGGFWSHCGWDSTIESTSEGVAMICTPFFMDQRKNARYISHVWRVGFELENGLKETQ